MAPEREQARLFIGEPILTDEAVRRYLRERGVEIGGVESVRPAEQGMAHALDLLDQPTMFSSTHTVWIKGLEPEPAEAIEELLERLEAGLAAGTLLVATASAVDRRTRLYKYFEKSRLLSELRVEIGRGGRLKDTDLKRLVAERVAGLGLPPLPAAAMAEILRRAGTVVGQLLQEVDKLCLCHGLDRPLGANEVRELMTDQAGAWVFDLTDALGQRDLAGVHRQLDELLAAGEAPQRLLPMLATRVGSLFEASRAIARLGRGWERLAYPAFLKGPYERLPSWARRRFPANFGTFRTFQDAAAFTSSELRRLHAHLLNADRRMKRSSAPPSALLAEALEAACLGA